MQIKPLGNRDDLILTKTAGIRKISGEERQAQAHPLHSGGAFCDLFFTLLLLQMAAEAGRFGEGQQNYRGRGGGKQNRISFHLTLHDFLQPRQEEW